jgi:hypothetical protein
MNACAQAGSSRPQQQGCRPQNNQRPQGERGGNRDQRPQGGFGGGGGGQQNRNSGFTNNPFAALLGNTNKK